MNPVDLLRPVIRPRRSLKRGRAALARGHLTVGFLGGSFTDPSTGNRWPGPVLAWLAETRRTRTAIGFIAVII
ncbi:MAG: hypothetical protein NT173_02820 [Opitutales bacterium]|nr:hypothetical protein [Opitutales bacterium]